MQPAVIGKLMQVAPLLWSTDYMARWVMVVAVGAAPDAEGHGGAGDGPAGHVLITF